jgi:uncharacterized Zn finger protein (UPF0148 family)
VRRRKSLVAAWTEHTKPAADALMAQMLAMCCPHCGLKLEAHRIDGELAHCPTAEVKP